MTKKLKYYPKQKNGNPKFRTVWNGQDPDPLTTDRMMTTFSTDERLAFYDYCIKNTEGPPIPPEFDINISETSKKEEKELTYEEKLEQERNAKRRRIKYKSVHTGQNKTYTEVMREVIGNQMELYEEYLAKQAQSIKREEDYHVETHTIEVLTSSSQSYLYPDNNFTQNEYNQSQAQQESQYYDDQYEKYIPTDYFPNNQSSHTSNDIYSYAMSNSAQVHSNPTDFTNYYNGGIYEDLDKQLSIPSTHSTYSDKSRGKDHSEKSYHEGEPPKRNHSGEKHSSDRFSPEKKDSHRNNESKRKSPVSDSRDRKYKEYDRRHDNSRERLRDDVKYPSRDRYRELYEEETRLGHKARSKRDYRHERRKH